MFMGVRAYHQVARVTNYSQARKVLEACKLTPTGRQRRPVDGAYPLGLMRRGATCVHEFDGKIAFRLYDTDVVVWHPDDSFEVDNYGTSTTTGFAAHFTPPGIHLHHPSREGGHVMVSYPTARHQMWQDRAMVQGSVIHFKPAGDDLWAPDLDTCDELHFLRIDPIKARELRKLYNFTNLAAQAGMLTRYVEIEHEGFDLDDCIDALEVGDMRKLIAHLPLIEDQRHYGRWPTGWPVRTRRGDIVGPASVERLRLALLDYHGAIEDVTFKVITEGELEKHMRLLRPLRKLNIASWRIGPRT